MTSSTSQPPRWVSFPAHAMPGVDWTDHGAAHRAVMRMFSPELPGPAGQRRAAADVLFRVDPGADGIWQVLVQSTQPPMLLPPDARSMTVPAAAWDLTEGASVALRVAVNAVVRRTDKSGPKRREVTTLVPEPEVAQWVTDRLAPAVAVRDVVNHVRASTRARRAGAGCPPLVVTDTIDAIGTVTDPAELKNLRRHGVGRAKAYGCGLLTLVPTRA